MHTLNSRGPIHKISHEKRKIILSLLYGQLMIVTYVQWANISVRNIVS